MTNEQSSIIDSNPIERIRRFAGLLHWRGLRLERILFTDDQVGQLNLPSSGIITYYMTTDLKFNLQINELSKTPVFTHQATIKADRYGIRDIGWHPFTLFDNDEKLQAEAERVRPWLDRNLFKDTQWLSNLKRKHPQFLIPKTKLRRGREFGK